MTKELELKIIDVVTHIVMTLDKSIVRLKNKSIDCILFIPEDAVAEFENKTRYVISSHEELKDILDSMVRAFKYLGLDYDYTFNSARVIYTITDVKPYRQVDMAEYSHVSYGGMGTLKLTKGKTK